MQATGRASPGDPPFDGDLHRRLLWLTFFRLAIVSVLFTSTLILSRGETSDLPSGLVFQLLGVAGAGFLATLGFALLLRARRHLTFLAYAEITADVMLAGMLVYLTGGSSLFSFVFILSVVNASLVLFQRGALVAASLSSVTFAVIKAGLNSGWLMPAATFQVKHDSPANLVWGVFVNLSAFFLVAALASYLSGQLRDTGAQLSARELDYEALTALHESILTSIPSGIATIDSEGRVTYVNRAGQEICQTWLARPGPGLPLGELLPGAVLVSAPMNRQELEIHTQGGGSRWLGLTVSELRPVGNAPPGHAVVFQDLTELRQLELEARRNERLAAVGTLAAGLAHELRNPLASMSGAVQMLTSSARNDPDEQKLVGIVVGETDRLNRLITDFLGFARPAPLHPAPVDLGALTEQTLDIVCHSPTFERVKVVRSLEPGQVMGDGSLLRQALWNLLLNAGQALDGQAGQVTVRVRAEGRVVVLEVEDDGPGINPADLPHLFEPFFTTKAGGTGLGLSTVQAVVTAHGGQLHAENHAPHGARFTIRLARCPEEAGESVGAPVALAQGARS